jgi:hypothetical protein
MMGGEITVALVADVLRPFVTVGPFHVYHRLFN